MLGGSRRVAETSGKPTGDGGLYSVANASTPSVPLQWNFGEAQFHEAVSVSDNDGLGDNQKGSPPYAIIKWHDKGA